VVTATKPCSNSSALGLVTLDSTQFSVSNNRGIGTYTLIGTYTFVGTYNQKGVY
jgi:hypothetical protein